VRKLVVTELLSLDGVAEAPDSFFGWDEAVDAKIPELIATQDAVILGRRSYDEWAQFWPSSQIEPFATFINGVEKYVATSTPLNQEWANSTVVDGGLVEFVRAQAPARRRHRRPRKHLGRPGAARRRRCRRAHARDSADDRRPRTTTPRRLATDPARIDPKRDLTDWLPDRRLSRSPLTGEHSNTGLFATSSGSPCRLACCRTAGAAFQKAKALG
jgi:hypothetical protein